MLMPVILPAGAFILALLAISAMILLAAISSRWPHRLFSWLMWLILGASVGTIVLSGRVLRLNQYESLMIVSEGDVGSTLIAKLLLVVVIGCSFSLCVAWFFQKKRKKKDSRFAQRGLQVPSDVIIAFLVFYIAFSILPLFFGQRYHFHISLIYPFFTFLALFLWMRVCNDDPVKVAKLCLCVIVFGSLFAAVLMPQLSVQPGYIGLIPGFNMRLWGITAHANGLGSVASALLVLEVAEPSRRSWVRRTIIIAAATTMVLAQSKTSILAALVGLLVILIWRVLLSYRENVKIGNTNQRLIVTGFIAVFCGVAVVIGAWAMFSDTALLRELERNLNARAMGDLSTGTGRTYIWEVAIEGGLENPLFGQGLGFWSVENQRRWGLVAMHAHNLFLQVFSRSGFVGLLALLVFLYFLLQYAIRGSKSTRGGSVAIITVLLTRAMTESTISPNAILGSEFFAMMAYFIYIIDRGAKPFLKSHPAAPSRMHFSNVAGFK